MNYLPKLKTKLKNGNEKLFLKNFKLQKEYKILDFWKWAYSDILSNSIRGKFAEFIIATALDIDLTKPSEEWNPYDLTTKEGIKIEIKTSAYIQSWGQKKLSKPIFSIRPTKYWDDKKGFQTEIKRQSDFYIFCLLKETDQEKINPLNLDQWEFYILSTKKLNKEKQNQKTISLNPLKKIAKNIPYNLLKSEFEKEVKNNF